MVPGWGTPQRSSFGVASSNICKKIDFWPDFGVFCQFWPIWGTFAPLLGPVVGWDERGARPYICPKVLKCGLGTPLKGTKLPGSHATPSGRSSLCEKNGSEQKKGRFRLFWFLWEFVHKMAKIPFIPKYTPQSQTCG